MAVITYHTMISGCQNGEREAWGEFARRLSPYAIFILEHSFPELAQESSGHLDRIFAQMREGDFFSAFQGRREREFLMHFRGRVWDYGLGMTPVPETPLDRELLEKVTDGFSMTQQQILWMNLQGVGAPTAAAVLLVDAATVVEVLKKTNTNLRALLDRWSASTLAESGRSLMRAARGWSGSDCLGDHVFGKMIDGQTSWQDREKIERHVRSCFYCVDRYTACREVVYCLRKLPLAEEKDVSRILAAVGIHAEEKKKGLLSKLFSKSHAV